MIVTQQEVDSARKARLDEIEQALKFDPDPTYRAELRREYLGLTNQEEGEPQ